MSDYRTGGYQTTTYQQRVNAERVANQAPEVIKALTAILQSASSIVQAAHWALDPDEKDGGAYYAQNLLDHAHELIDQAHTFRAALKANPPPTEDDNGEDDAA